jgi:transcriptional regulator with XRE-family HTH domain
LGEREHCRQIFAAQFHLWRTQAGLPLKKISSELGVSIAIVSAWEHGVRFPRPDNLDCLRQYSRLPLSFFLCPQNACCLRRPR